MDRAQGEADGIGVAAPALGEGAVELGGDPGDLLEREPGDLAQGADQGEALEVAIAVVGLVVGGRDAGRQQAAAEIELDRGGRDAGPAAQLGDLHGAEIDMR